MTNRLSLPLFLGLADFLIGIGSGRVTYTLMRRPDLGIEPAYDVITLAIPLLFIMKMNGVKAYQNGLTQRLTACLRCTTIEWLKVSTLFAAALVVTGSMATMATQWWIAWVCMGLLGLWTIRLLIFTAYHQRRIQPIVTRRLAIVGAGHEGQDIARGVLESDTDAFFLVGLYDDRVVPDREAQPTHRAVPIPAIGTTQDLLAAIRDDAVDHVIIAMPLSGHHRIRDFIVKLRTTPIDISISLLPLNGGGLSAKDLSLTTLNGMPLLDVIHSPIGPWGALIKRAFDLIVGLLGLVVLSPLLLLIALAIRLDSPGPILFRQERGGFNNHRFNIFKFRSMRIATTDQFMQTCHDDPRNTQVGRFLRRWSLDELPQLINVIRGELSLVGPRPHATVMDDEYALLFGDYVCRTRVKPGITGWAQVNGQRGATLSTASMAARLELDLFYIQHWSFWLDLLILMKTIATVMRGINAY